MGHCCRCQQATGTYLSRSPTVSHPTSTPWYAMAMGTSKAVVMALRLACDHARAMRVGVSVAIGQDGPRVTVADASKRRSRIYRVHQP